MTIRCFVAVVLIGSASLFGQDLRTPPRTAAVITQRTAGLAAKPGSSGPAILNVLTVIGNEALGVPCIDCLLGILIPSLGLPSPLGEALVGSKYQIDSYLIDNTYTGSCTFNLAVRDSQNNVVAEARQTIDETAGNQILLSTPITIPPSAGLGLGSVSNTATCGSNVSESKSPVVLTCVNNPPFCVD